MANLAIKGHASRGSEVIALLEMLGGKNIYNLTGTKEIWYILSDGTIEHSTYIFDEKRFALEEFLEKFPYKVGDKVNYVKYNDECPSVYTIQGMWWTGVTINYVLDLSGFSALTKDLQPYKEETMENKSNLLHQLKEYFESTPREVIEKEWHKYDKYNEISPKVNEYLEYVNNIRHPKYPKTFIEVLNFWHPDRQLEDDYQRCYKKDLVEKLQDLLYARDAYWKIAGEQMGLGKPWKPDWLNAEQDKYVLFTHNNAICSKRYVLGHNILAFPTEEMRDAFYENFKELIEAVKELL